MNIRIVSPLFIVSLLICTTVFVSCKKDAVHASKTQPAKKQIQTSHGSYNPSTTVYWDLIHTKLEVSFDYSKQHMHGQATISMKPQFYAQKDVILNAKGFDIHSVAVLNGPAITTYTYNALTLNISLPKAYSRTDTLHLVINYTAKPNDLPKSGSDAITEEKGLYFIDPLGTDPNKPTQIWTQGETESASCWFPTFDSPNQRCTQEMYITADKKYTVISNGELIYKTEQADGTNVWYWKMSKPHAPYLFMMAIGEFSKVTDHWNDTEVSYYVEPDFAPYAQKIFGSTPQMIDYFSKKLNYPFPWNKYSQIVVRDFVSGAMENTSASIFMEDLQVDDRYLVDANWESIIVHELFHHWFGDLVTCESWANLPLNESFANFSEFEWLAYKFGEDEGLLHVKEDLDSYLQEAETTQNPLIRYNYLDKEEMFDRHSYNKGGLTLRLLKSYVGEDAFYESLSLYLKRNEFSAVEIDELRIAFEDVTGEDLHWFFDTWFLKPGHASLKVNDYSDKYGKTELSIEQTQDTIRGTLYRIPLMMEYRVKGDTSLHSERIWVSKQKQTYSIPYAPDQITYLMVDPGHMLVGTIEHKKSRTLLAGQFLYGADYLTRLEALEQLLQASNAKEDPYVTYPENSNYLLKGLNDPFHKVRETALLQFTKHLVPNLESTFIPKIEEMAKNEPDGEIRALAIMLLASFNKGGYIDIYRAGIDAPSYYVAGACLSSLLDIHDEATIARLPEFEQMNNINITTALAEYYVNNGIASHYDWFESKMKQATDQETYNLMGLFARYVLIQKNENREKGKALLKKISEENSYEIIRQNALKYYEAIVRSEKTEK